MSDSKEPDSSPKGQFLVYRAEDGRVQIDVRLENETVWLTQQHMAELFQTTQKNISLHIQNIYQEGELQPAATHKESLSVRQEGKNYLNEDELAALNNLVEQYLVFAEGQAMRRVPMHMRDWIAKLNGFLTLNERAILNHAGKISHEMAKELARWNTGSFTANRFSKPTRPGALLTKPSNNCRRHPSRRTEARNETWRRFWRRHAVANPAISDPDPSGPFGPRLPRADSIALIPVD